MDSRAKLVGNIVDSIAELGFSDIKSNPKHGTIEIPAQQWEIAPELG